MRKRLLFLLIFNLILFSTLKAQKNNEREIFAESWKKGNEQITIQTLQVKLTQENSKFEKEVFAMSGKKYLISVVKNPAVDLKGEHWKVVLNEVPINRAGSKDLCKDLLLVDYPCDSGGDYFSRENDIAYFYPSFPYDKVDMKIPRREWVPFYSTDRIRKILVDGFFVIIRSGDIEFDEKDKSKIKSFEINIDLRNNLTEESAKYQSKNSNKRH